MKLHLKISSKNKNSQALFLKTIAKIWHKNNLNLNYFVKNSQQIKIKYVFTILKSPHVNKTAQEQFEYNLSSKKLKFYTFRLLKLIIMLRKLRSELFPDVETKVYIVLNIKGSTKFKNYRLNPNAYKLKVVKYPNTDKLLSYLTLFDFNGSLKPKFV
jgi:ribosomal protein S10